MPFWIWNFRNLFHTHINLHSRLNSENGIDQHRRFHEFQHTDFFRELAPTIKCKCRSTCFWYASNQFFLIIFLVQIFLRWQGFLIFFGFRTMTKVVFANYLLSVCLCSGKVFYRLRNIIFSIHFTPQTTLLCLAQSIFKFYSIHNFIAINNHEQKKWNEMKLVESITCSPVSMFFCMLVRLLSNWDCARCVVNLLKRNSRSLTYSFVHAHKQTNKQTDTRYDGVDIPYKQKSLQSIACNYHYVHVQKKEGER